MNDPIETYDDRTRESRSLYEEASRYLPGGDTREVTYHPPYPAFVESAQGAYLHTVDDEELLDFLNNYTQAVVGHANETVTAAVVDRFERDNGFAAPTREATELARRIAERVPSVDQVRFTNSGTEATMNAIRAAIAQTRTDEVLKLQGGFHGTHDTVLVGVSGEGRENPGIPRSVEDRVHTAPANDVEALKTTFERHGDDLAAFILEPVMGHLGMVPLEPAFLETARDLTRDTDTVLIFDEVMTFRFAEGGAQERYGVTPDLTTLGKFIGGGIPAGAFGGREDIMQVFHPEAGVVKHSGTFNGNPAAMAGGLAVLDILDASTIERLNDLGALARDRLEAAGAEATVPIRITGDASFFNVHFADEPVVDEATSTAGSEATRRLFLGMRNRGVFLAPRGMGNISTPMDERHIDRLVEAFEGALADVPEAIA